MRTIIVLLVSLSSLAACGLKGPLYVPDRSAEGVNPAASRPAPVVSEEQRPVPTEAIPAPK